MHFAGARHSWLLKSFPALLLLLCLFKKIRNIIVLTALKDCCLNQLILLGATNTATFFANHPCVAAKTQPQKARA